MSFFERWLTLWVALCIVAGVILGQQLHGPVQALGRMELAQVNIPVGLLIWVMIIPMLVRVDFGALHRVREHVRGIGVTLAVNWLVKPFSMALLGWIFIRHLFAPWLPAAQSDSYIAGLILLAAERLAQLNPGALLSNTSRGPQTDEPALAEALKEGRLAGAGLDVLSVEPQVDGSPLQQAPNCFITPHIACATRAARERLLSTVVANIKACVAGKTKNVVV